jgi:hypothetical protein
MEHHQLVGTTSSAAPCSDEEVVQHWGWVTADVDSSRRNLVPRSVVSGLSPSRSRTNPGAPRRDFEQINTRDLGLNNHGIMSDSLSDR